MIAIVGGLGAAILWALATVASSRSSRMLGSRVVLGWIMIVGTVIGVPIALATPLPASIPPEAPILLLLAGLCYSGGLYAAYRALTIGKVSIVAPIVATEGGVAALIAVALGDQLAATAGVILALIAVGVVLSSIEPARPVVPAGDFELEADALDGPARDDGPTTPTTAELDAAEVARRTRQAVILSMIAAVVFGVGLVTSGKAAALLPPIWVALSARFVGLAIVTLPLVLQGRLSMTRRALPLILLSGTGEIVGSTLSAWGATDSIAIVAVLGSQFAAIAAVIAFLLFGERLSKTQVLGVVLIGGGVTALALVSA